MDTESRQKSEFEPPKYLAGLIAAVNDGAKAAQGGALLLMLVGLYLLATAFSASDEDLLRARTLTIVQIGATLPVSFSFAIAPLVFVFLHIYTLTRYDMLAANVRQFCRELNETVEIEADRDRCRQLLANVEFVGALTTPYRSVLYPRFWSWLFIGIVAMFPIVVLLLVQINALRYQSDLITIVQRVWFVLDLGALVWFFARDPLSVPGAERARVSRSAARWGLLIGLPVLLIGLNFYWLGTAPPDAAPGLVRYDPEDPHWDNHPKPSIAWQPLDLWSCPRLNWGCRFLRVDHRTLVDKVWEDKAMTELRAAGIEPDWRISRSRPSDKTLGGTEQGKALAGIEGLVLRGRSLRFAVLDESRLYAADLIGTDLRQASLRHARLPGARLLQTKLQRADLHSAQLPTANLGGARLQGADLSQAQLQDANLSGARLQGAFLPWAKLQGMNLTSIEMRGADLAWAQLSDANLDDASLQGADLEGAKLQGAYLSDAQLQGANLADADLQGAYLFRAQLQGADLRNAHLQGADLFGAQLQGAMLADAHLQGADLRSAHLWRATSGDHPVHFALVDLRGADFGTPLTKKQQANLVQILASILDWNLQRQAEKRLQSVLSPEEGPAPPFDVIASPSHPMLANSPPHPVLAANLDWLISAPTPAYNQALADYLVGELAPVDPAIARGIAIRAGIGLQAEATRPTALAIACRLLANPGALGLKQDITHELSKVLKKEQLTCPVASATAQKTN